MKAAEGTEREREGSDPAISGQVCPVTGYKYGHKWLYEAVPADKLNRLCEIFGVTMKAA